MSYLCADNFTFEKTESNTIKILIKLEYTEEGKFVFDTDLSIFWFIVISPFLVIFSFLALIASIIFMLIRPAPSTSLSYEEAKEIYQNNQSYLDSLSTEQTDKLLSKKDNLPLGL